MKLIYRYLISTIILFTTGYTIQGQCLSGDTISMTSGDTTFAVAAPATENMLHYYNTATDTNDRVIFLIPGLSGNKHAWQDVHDETEGITNEYPLYPARKAAIIKLGTENGPGYTEASGLASAGGEVYDYMVNQVNYTSLGVDDIDNNIAICHSQGGLVGRATDYIMHHNGKTPHFGGLVTFGSTHQGAEILTNGLPVSKGGQGKIQDFANELCTDLSDGPVMEELYYSDNFFLKMVRLFNFDDEVLDLKDHLCHFISDTILPFAMEGKTPNIATDYMASNEHYTASNYLVNTLNNYSTNISMVAFYGVEKEPVLWRQLGSMATKVHTYSAFQADPDQQYVDDVADLQVQYYAKYLTFKGHADWHKDYMDFYCSPRGFFLLPFYGAIKCMVHENKYFTHKATKDAYKRGYDFLKDANKKWKAIIGARKTEVVQNGYICDCYYIDSGENTTVIVQNQSECPEGRTNTSQGKRTCFSFINYETNIINKESDGVALAESAKNLPGAIVNPNLSDKDYELEDTNHQQLRNSSKTAEKLNDLFDTNKFGQFFKTSTR